MLLQHCVFIVIEIRLVVAVVVVIIIVVVVIESMLPKKRPTMIRT